MLNFDDLNIDERYDIIYIDEDGDEHCKEGLIYNGVENDKLVFNGYDTYSITDIKNIDVSVPAWEKPFVWLKTSNGLIYKAQVVKSSKTTFTVLYNINGNPITVILNKNNLSERGGSIWNTARNYVVKNLTETEVNERNKKVSETNHRDYILKVLGGGCRVYVKWNEIPTDKLEEVWKLVESYVNKG